MSNNRKNMNEIIKTNYSKITTISKNENKVYIIQYYMFNDEKINRIYKTSRKSSSFNSFFV